MVIAWDFWLTQFFNGLQLSMLLVLLSIGLTVIFGLMHFVNLAHGALYMLGAYVAVTVAPHLPGGFWAALIVAPLAVALIGVVLHLAIIQRMRRAGPLSHVLVTFGLIFVAVDGVRILWGDLALGIEQPAMLAGPVHLLGIDYPAYRLFIIALGLAILGLFSAILSRTEIGAMIRASVENESMAACAGIDVDRLFFSVFCVGCALAGFAGAIAAPIYSATPGMATDVLIPTLVVVVVGGLGSLRGAVVGSLIVGFLQTFGAVLTPSLSSVLIYLLLAAILVVRPEGLMPARL